MSYRDRYSYDNDWNPPPPIRCDHCGVLVPWGGGCRCDAMAAPVPMDDETPDAEQER